MTALWTIVPVESLLAGDAPSSYPQREVSYGGITMLVEDVTAEQHKIVQILSTNPNDYLREEFQPGTILRFG